ncbi:hypothetical protein IW140_003831 [Coemansia sp. RSA 1813]|nr:hypothetical protein EV178_001694 [Coemansia sp. RSA 1646]KAJ1768046.1 hypothetical protein LPJ74_005036 [Coemansia sp. RSA 1843]KAJ2090082.1 hypothetical protein IW138_002892 [Coemansia sp. RSA 986]KAJ2211413.1 hypothetical protein EV179_005505 [Coemansia sp. RSA 487]KAJ2568513.1 hypothetical protein IW140_003831 [Coemansia sp. RSA 1813]
MTSSTVRVALRIRPLSSREHINGETECVTQLPGVPQIVIGADRAFTFDYVFSPEVSQEQVYNDTMRPLVTQFLQGYNATVLAYGQTGSGKTFSMGTGLAVPDSSMEMQGVVPRAIKEIWHHLAKKSAKHGGFTYSVDVSFLELYNEDLVDLLNPRMVAGGSGGNTRGPTIREDSRGNMVLVGVERKSANCEDDIIGYLHQGALSRTTASTDMNRTSSRSHAIFTIYLRQQERKASAIYTGNQPSPPMSETQMTGLDGGPSIVSKIHFVDLAGSERIKRTGAAGDRAKEGISINAGLLALGNVISALGGAIPNGNASSNGTAKRSVHIPYRDSKLTRLLQDSLGGNSQTAMLACISPSDKNSNESLNTIRYANRARNIRNKVAVNFDKNSSVELNMLKTEVARLRGELSNLKLLKRQSSIAPADQTFDSGSNHRHVSEILQLQAKNSNLVQQLDRAMRRAEVLEKDRDSLRAKVASFGGSVHPTPQLESSKLPDPESLTASTTPTSQMDDGDLMMSRSNMLETLDRELTEQAERHENQINSVRRHYESKLELVQESLSVVQKERDVALEFLAKSKKSTPAKLQPDNTSGFGRSTPTAAAEDGTGTQSPGRKTLGLDSSVANTTPTKIRIPSRASKDATAIAHKKASVDLRGVNKPLISMPRTGSSSGISSLLNTADADASMASMSQNNGHSSAHTKELEDEIRRLKTANKQLKEHASADADRFALQIQDQAKEISRLRRQRTGRKGSHRYSLLAFKENSWGATKTATSQADDQGGNDGPNLLRAAFIKAVIEHELQRCIQARQLLRERDSHLNKQDELMNEQNDLLLCIQNIDLESDDESGTAQMQRATERIELIDAELHYLDLKVRDVEAEVAQLAEAATAAGSGCKCGSSDSCKCSSTDMNGGGLLGTTAIINMSGLAMRMVEDVVRIDYRAFSSLFESLSAKDSTGLSYLLIQDIIELRLLAHNDKRDKIFLEEQIMDLRRTLLAMQKTALNAALTYERELGDAERKLVQIQLPHQPSAAPLANPASVQHRPDGILASRPAVLDANPPPPPGMKVASLPSLERFPSDRSVYDGVRERGILLRSVLMGAAAMAAEPVSTSSTLSRVAPGGSDSMEDIRGAKAPIVELADDVSDFGSLRINSLRDYHVVNPSLASSSIAAIAEVPELRDEDTDSDYADTRDMMGPLDQVHTPHHAVRSAGIKVSISTSAEVGSTPSVVSDSAQSLLTVDKATESVPKQTASPIESDTSYLENDARDTATGGVPTEVDIDVLSEDAGDYETDYGALGGHYHGNNDDEVFFSNPEMSGSEADDVPELYRSGSGEFFRIPNLARNPSVRSQNNHHSFRPTYRRNSRRHILRRMSIRKPAPKIGGKSVGTRLGTRAKDKRRISLRKTRISMPIVPPEMIEYIDKCNPMAIKVGLADPLVGSPEVLQRMNIQQTNEYHNNIAAFASFALQKKQPASLRVTPRAAADTATKIAEPAVIAPQDMIVYGADGDDDIAVYNTPVTHNVFIPRSAGKIRSRVSVVGSTVPEHELHHVHGYSGAQVPDIRTMPMLTDAYSSADAFADGNIGHADSPISAATGTTSQSQLRSPTLLYQNDTPYMHNGQVPLSSSMSIGDQPKDMYDNIPPQQDIRAMLSIPVNDYNVKDPSMGFAYGQGGNYSSGGHTQQTAFEPYDRLSPPEPKHRYLPPTEPKHHYLSPTERANASLFSILDAAKTSAVKFDESVKSSKAELSNNRRHSRASHVYSSDQPITPERASESFESPYGSNRNSCQMHDSPMQGPFESKPSPKGTRTVGAKPSRIRRRALTEFDENAIDAVGERTISNTKPDKQQLGGGSRLSKLLSGIGFGGKNNKQLDGNSGCSNSPLPRRPHTSSKTGGGMVSSTALEVGRDRSCSDTAGARKGPVRKVHSNIDGVVTERRRDKWLMTNEASDFSAVAFANAFSTEGDHAENSGTRSRGRSRMEVPFMIPAVRKDHRFYSRRSSMGGATESMYT